MKTGMILFPSLFLVFFIFLKIGLIFFGGGYVVLPVIHRELVANLHLLTEQEFIDGMAISQITPGPVAIMATFAGYIIANFWGAILATIGMFLPGCGLMFIISKNYEKINNSEFATNVLNKTIPVIVGLLIAISLQLGHRVLNNSEGVAAFAIAMFLLVKYRVNPAILILIYGIGGMVLNRFM